VTRHSGSEKIMMAPHLACAEGGRKPRAAASVACRSMHHAQPLASGGPLRYLPGDADRQG